MVVAHIGDELLVQGDRQRRIAPGYRQRDDGRRIGQDQEPQLGRVALERRAIPRQRLQSPRAARRWRKAPVDARPSDAQLLDARFERPSRARKRNACRAAREHGRSGRQGDEVRTHEQRLVGAAEIRRKACREPEIREERGQRNVDLDLTALASATRRAQEEISVDRAHLLDDVAVCIEREDSRFPGLARSARPQRHTLAAGHRDRRGDAAAAAHRPAIHRQPHRRMSVPPRPHRMPERRGATGRGRARQEQDHTGERRARAGRHAPACGAAHGTVDTGRGE